MELTDLQKRHLLTHGYVRVPGVVPPIMVEAALRAINHSLGEGIDPAQLPTFRARSYCPELSDSPVITDLVNRTPALPLLESVLGQGRVKRATAGQVALRFPRPPGRIVPARPHLDGMHTPANGVPRGEIWNFTALLGVFLSDVPEENRGNLTVWPGSHRLYEAHFRQRGPQSLLEGMPQVPLPEPVQVTGRAGDIVLAHYLLGHGVGFNASPHIRYMCFFRIEHVEHEAQKFPSMTDAWLHWPGIRALEQEPADRPEG